MYTPIQRADRLIGGHDLERLTSICKNQKSIKTKILLIELKRVKKLLAIHGLIMKSQAHENRNYRLHP